MDLTKADLPPNHGIKHAGSDIEAAVYAVVENALCVNGGETTSEIFVPVTKEVGGLTNNRVSHLRFYLADAEAFVEPISVIPDIGGPPNNYFMVRDRDNWRQAFSAWLQTPLDINEEISDYDSETDGSGHADNWDCVSVDSGDQLGGSADDASDSL